MSFISNPFMQADMTCIAEQLSAAFNLDAGEVEMEILTLQSNIQLKAPQCSLHSIYESCLSFWFNLFV